MTQYRRIAQLKTPGQFRDYLASLEIDLPFDEDMQSGPDAPLAQPHTVKDFTLGNRWCVLPMEGSTNMATRPRRKIAASAI